jgi:hypothetical protein
MPTDRLAVHAGRAHALGHVHEGVEHPRLRAPASSMRIITLVSRPSKMRGGAK